MSSSSITRVSVFSKLVELEATIIKVGHSTTESGGIHYFSDYCKNSLVTFLGFIRSGSFAKSEKDKFILRNYEMDNKSLTVVWNTTKNTNRTEATTRVQKRNIATMITSMFGDIYTISNVFLSDDERQISEFMTKVRVFSAKDLSITDIAISNIVESVPIKSDKVFELSDCVDELKYLCMFSYKNMDRYLQQINKDKLAFVLSIMREPLFTKGYVVNENKYKINRLLLDNFKTTTLDLIVSTNDFVSSKIEESSSKDEHSLDFRSLYEKQTVEIMELRAKCDELSLNTDVELLGINLYQDFYSALTEVAEKSVGTNPTAKQLEDVVKTLAFYDKVTSEARLQSLDPDTVALVLRILAGDEELENLDIKQKNVLMLFKQWQEKFIG